MTTAIIFASILILATLFNAALITYTIYRDTTISKRQFELQIAAASSNKMPDIHKMAYSDLMKVVNDTIDYYTTQNLTINPLVSKSSEEISLILDDLSADIATKVKTSVSTHVSQCITCYITEDFYDRYILNNVRLLLVAHIEHAKRASRGTRRPPQKTILQDAT